MRIPWDERQARIAEIKRQLQESPPPPRLALRLARFFIGNDYEEEVIPAEMLNALCVVILVVLLGAAVIAIALVWHNLVALELLLTIAAAIWPVARLGFLNQNDVLLRDHEGIANPQAERLFSWIALACVVATPTLIWLGAHHDTMYFAFAVLAGIMYSSITYMIFEDFFNGIAVGTWESVCFIGFLVLLVLVLLTVPEKELAAMGNDYD